MQKLNILKSQAILLIKDNVDTDQIIPARFLKAISRENFGEKLFYDWRFDSNGLDITTSPIPKTNVNYSILITGDNFGCGSSREHAAWAIYDYGFRVVIAPTFADIFKNNALNCGILPIEISLTKYYELLNITKANPSVEISLNLEKQIIYIGKYNYEATFPINSYKKECFLNGFDDIDYLLSHKENIINYEQKYSPVTW